MKLISWNVNGIRAVAKKGFIDWVHVSPADVICIQETKAHIEQLTDDIINIDGFTSYWESGERKGYSGVATYCKKEPESVSHGFGLDPKFDREGRILVTGHPGFLLCNIYFPNGKMNEDRLQYKLDFYDAALEYFDSQLRQGNEIIICGDFNTAHNEIDLARPKANEDVSGFLRIERDWMDKLEEHGYVDTFRYKYPDRAEAYTWWSFRSGARQRNVGWRLDYFYVSPNLENRIVNANIMPGVMGSDHCPVVLEID